MSVSLDIYRTAVGCDGYTPQLKPNIKKVNDLQEELLSLKDQVNLAWVPVYSSKRYIEQLSADVQILYRQIVLYHQLGMDIVNLIDEGFYEQYKSVFHGIEDHNFSIDEFEEMVANVTKKGEEIATRFEKLKLFQTSPIKIPKLYVITAAADVIDVSLEYIRGFRDAMNAFYQTQLGSPTGKLTQFKEIAKSRWKIFKYTNPRVSNVLQRVKTPFRKLPQWKTTGIIVSGAKTALGAFAFVHEIANQMEFKRLCEEKLIESQKILALQLENKKNLTTLLEEVKTLATDLELYYLDLKRESISEMLIDFTFEVITMFAPSQVFGNEIDQMKEYVSDIKGADTDLTNTMNKELIKSFTKVNTELDCIYQKLKILREIVDKCGDGRSTRKKLFVEFTPLIKGLPSQCSFKEVMTEETFQNFLNEIMEAMTLQSICVRNNPNKLQLACKNWYNGLSLVENSNTIEDTTAADIEYYISKCEGGYITKDTETSICSMKEEGKPLSGIINEYRKFNEEQITNIYKIVCKLSRSTVLAEQICFLKNYESMRLEIIQNKFSQYTTLDVKTVYDKCASITEILSNDKKAICNLIKAGFDMDEHFSMWQPLFEKYGEELVRTFCKTCPSKDVLDVSLNDKQLKCNMKVARMGFDDEIMWQPLLDKYGKDRVKQCFEKCLSTEKDFI